jgi:hypothetical protein
VGRRFLPLKSNSLRLSLSCVGIGLLIWLGVLFTLCKIGENPGILVGASIAAGWLGTAVAAILYMRFRSGSVPHGPLDIDSARARSISPRFGVSTGRIALFAVAAAVFVWPATQVLYAVCLSWGAEGPKFIGSNAGGGGDCSFQDYSGAQNADGYVAQVRRSVCIGLRSALFEYFVFVRHEREKNSASNLVLSFLPGDDGFRSAIAAKPVLTWLGPRSLSITVHNTGYLLFDKLSNLSGVTITYRFLP